ncbi:Transposable element Tc3 transposase [Anthophora plagiata]
MPRGNFLSESEKASKAILNKRGESNRKIAKEIHRSECVVRNFLKMKENYGKKCSTKGNSKITKREKNIIFYEATKNRLVASQIVAKMQLPITKRRVQQILHNNSNIGFKKPQKKPMLKAHHKVARLEYAKNHMHWTDEWKRVIFSDEKKFNLDGPDGYSSYWHDLRQKNDPKLSRNFHGGSVMIWGAFSSYGKLKLCFINGKINSERYVDMLDGALIPFLEDTVGEREFIFQQDNAAIHVSKYSREWFKTRDIPLIEWPACSPDMNPIENLWGIMARNIYANGRQFTDTAALKEKIKRCWEEIPITITNNLINSMPSRIFALIQNNGGHTKY